MAEDPKDQVAASSNMSEEVTRKESGGGSIHQYENAAAVDKRQPRRGVVGHLKKWWWAHLIVFIVILLLVVLLVIFVGVPHIAQSKIDAAGLTIQGIVVSNTQTNNFTMAINSTITTDGSVHANIDAFDGVMYLEDLEPHTPFATVHFPATTAEALQTVNITQFTPITDMAAFTTFNTWLLANDTLRVTVKGDTAVRVSGLSRSYSVTFQKTVEMPGLTNFNGTTVSNTSISISPDADGNNFHGITTIPNRSLVTFDIGNASFHNYLLGAEVGTVFINNMVLYPGLNNFTMAANISQMPVLAAVGEQPYCQNGVLPFLLRGKTVVNNGQPLPYYADALGSSNQSVPIDLTPPLSALGLTVKCP